MYLKQIYNHIVLHRWELAFVFNPISDVIEGKQLQIERVKFPFHGRWYADPFILEYDEKEIVLLVEDYSDTDKKGKISKLTIIRETMKLKDVKIILELDTHLSFPVIVRKGEKVFFYPENSEGHTLDLYEYDKKTDVCMKIRQLSDEVMADAVISDYFGEKFLFSTKNNGNVLNVYRFDEEKNIFKYSTDVHFSENIARNGGDFFEVNGQLYRAAQECNYTYGHALSIQKIEHEGNTFKMKEVRRLLPPKYAVGMHTLNVYKDLIVIDLKVFRHPWIASPLFKIRNLFKHAR